MFRFIFIFFVFFIYSINSFSAKLCGPHLDIVDKGYSAGRAEVDFDGDGCLDYCRVVGGLSNKAIWCTMTFGPLKGRTVSSSEESFDWGYNEGRGWIDINKDNKADYCRVIGNKGFVDSMISCSISTGDGFKHSVNSNVTDWGYNYYREYRDCNNDGIIDFCRAVGNWGYSFIGCSPINYSSGTIDIPDAFSCKENDANRKKLNGVCYCVDRNNRTLSSNEMCSGYIGCASYCYDLVNKRLIDSSNNVQISYKETQDCPR